MTMCEDKDWRDYVRDGEKIDPAACGIGMTGYKGSPRAYVDGKEKFRRLFVRLRTPAETITCSPIRDGKDFAGRVSIIENWFNSVIRNGNYVLTFCAEQITDEEADELETKTEKY